MATTQPDPTEVNPALPTVRRLLRAIGTGALELDDDEVTPDYLDHGPAVPPPPGPAGLREALTFLTQVLDLRYEVLDEIVTPDRVVVRARAHGRGVLSVHGPEAAGRPYTLETIHVFRTEGHRLAEHWAVSDQLAALVQVGLVAPGELPPRRTA